jgi:hypothetical protein
MVNAALKTLPASCEYQGGLTKSGGSTRPWRGGGSCAREQRSVLPSLPHTQERGANDGIDSVSPSVQQRLIQRSTNPLRSTPSVSTAHVHVQWYVKSLRTARKQLAQHPLRTAARRLRGRPCGLHRRRRDHRLRHIDASASGARSYGTPIRSRLAYDAARRGAHPHDPHHHRRRDPRRHDRLGCGLALYPHPRRHGHPCLHHVLHCRRRRPRHGRLLQRCKRRES